MSESLTEFLLARIAEDEATVAATVERAASERIPADELGPWRTRVLAECEAKRRIVTAIAAWLDEHSDEDHVPAGDDALAWLGTIYADHPDYRDEWRP